ncbi:endoribonuclease Dicer homolog 3a [Magnolia sinica]|uniref:endoribonuclease Dicer homolog 3a n=1 Tax=Magnolia sinica TaxID=86752 RepID=UPI002657D033|nr:endoribonuclease Dicer homolog 3a [Magnolia sinica]
MSSTASPANPLKRPLEDGGPMAPAKKPAVAESPRDFDPRSYQIKVLQIALRRNTIAVLETGAGKTMIAVMLMKEVGKAMKVSNDNRLIIFMAPTVNLINQQFEVIKTHTDFKVAEYYGDKGVDNWSAQSWEKEISTQEVMVMTPQILLDALRNAFLTLDMIRLMIFDECHRASGRHPYTRIMKEFYHRSGRKPSVFGMTASPVVRKGVSSAMDCEDQIAELESILDSKVCTVEDRAELELFVPSAQEINRYYDTNLSLHDDLKAKLDSSWAKFDAVVANMQDLLPNQFKDTEDMIKGLRKRLSSFHAKILYCLDDLGLICAQEAAQVCMETARVANLGEGYDFSRSSFVQCKCFLEEVLNKIEETYPLVNGDILKAEPGYVEAVKMGYVSPKLYELMQIFQSFGGSKEVLCLIFVERIITAKVIERFMKKCSNLSHFTFSYLTGGNSSIDALTPKMQKNTLNLFRCGKVNLLFTTDVAEEGIDVHNCSCVIRFDLPKTVRSYVQSRGRARQHDSHYILMLERGNIKQRDVLFDIIRSEHSMADTASNRDPDASISKVCRHEDINAYSVESTGATVTPDSSVSLIYRYCEKLPGDKYFTPKPKFEFVLYGGSYECTLTLPPNAAFQTIVGPTCRGCHLSRQLVCLDACKKLHQMGALDDHLLPSVEEPSESDLIHKNTESASGAGTTKRKELHGTTTVHALSGNWAHKTDGVTMHAYKIDFACDLVSEHYSGFVLLMETKLDDDVACAKVDLYLVDKMAKSSIFPCGQVHLDSDQVKISKLFQEFFFNGLFGKLFIGSKSSGGQRKFLLETENNSLWSSMNMYLLLPLESSTISSHETLSINWKGISSCASIVEFMNTRSLVGADSCSTRSMESSSSSSTSLSKNEEIHFANNSVDIHDLQDMVVMAIHTGRIYSILDVMIDMSAESPFDVTSETTPSSFATFKDYFNKKYGVVLQHPGQPLLLLKQSHNAHNLLSSKSRYEGGPASRKARQKDCDTQAEKPLCHVHMPPELLVIIGVPISVLKSFYLLPSLMHRLESLMLASQLRKEIAFHSSNCDISSLLILEAITTLRCCEDFSLERLELLGDSVLKYAVSCHLFLTYPKKHEGQLSARRSWAVCNSTLHKLGINCKLQGYIRDSAFDPRRWVAPGQRSIRPVPCRCGVGTSEVPTESKYVTEDTSVVVGKACDRGHRWMCSKTISDCVESLIGAYFVAGGLRAALVLMKWLGIGAEIDLALVEEATRTAALWCHVPKVDEIETLESKLSYKFSVKGLLLEAITHASQQVLGAGYCYQRLEFLGDSVLDLLITRYLFQTHEDIDPGELTDLRSASVNNENFAQVAVRHNFQQHLQHDSGFLLGQINEYVKGLAEANGSKNLSLSLGGSKGPKVLGDIVESIAGAILIDTGLDLEKVWEIFEPLLSPIVTPDKLELPPLRELIELCSHLGYFINTKLTSQEEMVVAELGVQLKDVLLVREGRERSKKNAKGQAALSLLKDLEERGLSHARYVSKRKHDEAKLVGECSRDVDANISMLPEQGLMGSSSSKKQKMSKSVSPVEPSVNTSSSDHGNGYSMKACDANLNAPVTLSVNMEKGGPRTTLYQLCKRLQWPMPKFNSTEQKHREGIEASNGRKGFSTFVSKIILHIPNAVVIELMGDPRVDKKSSQDSAALIMLYELEKQGRCKIICL